MASSNEVSWASVFWPLVPIAMNSMFQAREPTGKTCGFDASLRIYTRSSPVICVVDAAFILIRFPFYMRGRTYSLRSLARAAKEIRCAHGLIDEEPKHGRTVREERRPGQLLTPEVNTFLFYSLIGAGVLTQLPKLMAYSGGSGAVSWTIAWAWFYFGAWCVVELTFQLARRAGDAHLSRARINTLETSIEPVEKLFGWAAIVIQLVILAAVDMKAIPPDPNVVMRWWFRGIRFAAHCAGILVYLPFRKITPWIDAERAVPRKEIGYLLIYILVPHVISALTQDKRYSSLYFMVSIMISYFSWMLYFFTWTKKFILFCEPAGPIESGDETELERRGRPQIRAPRGNGSGMGETKWQNVLAFDFFLRIVFFSAYWYVWHYDPTGTTKAQWTNYVG